MSSIPPLWVYKCNAANYGDFISSGNWDDFFASPQPSRWGGTDTMASTSSLGILRSRMQAGDLILCWQTDQRAAMGLCRVFDLRKYTDRDGIAQVEMVLKVVGKPFDPRVPLLTIKKTDKRMQAVRAFRHGFPATLYETNPREAADLLAICGVSLDSIADPKGEDSKNTKNTKKGGAGFGNSEDNKLIELAAEKIVMDAYVANGWKVHQVQSENCGYDFECEKGRRRQHVEVKGVRGKAPTFPITRNEVIVAGKDPLWKLAVVTDAVGHPQLAEWTAKEFLAEFDLTVINYMASNTSPAVRGRGSA